MHSQTEELRPSSIELTKLYASIEKEIENVFGKASNSESAAITYNYLRAMRNEIVKLMIMRDGISPDPACAEIVKSYMDPTKFISAPLDRKKLEAFKEEKQTLEQLKQNLSSGFFSLLSNMQSIEKQNKKIIYSSGFTELLDNLATAPRKEDPTSVAIEEIKLALQNTTQRHGKLYTDADLNQMQQNPYLEMSRQLITKISAINSSEIEDKEKLQEIHFILYKTKFDMQSSHFKGFDDQGLSKTIAAQVKKIEKMEPSVRKSSAQKIKQEKQLIKLCNNLLSNLGKIDIHSATNPLVKEILAVKDSTEPYAQRCSRLKSALEENQTTALAKTSHLRLFKPKDFHQQYFAMTNQGLHQLEKMADKRSLLQRLGSAFKR